MGEVANIYDGTHQTPKYTKEGVKFVSVENINDIENTNKFITPEAFQKEYKIKPQKGDILMTRITAGIIGATAIIKNNEPLGYYVSLALIRTKVDVDIIFLSQRVETNQFKNQLHKRIIHVAFPKKINLGDIQDCATYFPSLDEQKKISSLISLINDRILLSMKIIEQLETLMKGNLEKIFCQKLRFKDNEGNYFSNWKSMKLHEICEIKKGEQLNKDDLTKTGNYPCLNGGMNYSGYTDNFNSDENTITISEGGNSCGFVSFMKSKFWLGGHCYKVILKKDISTIFFFHLLKFHEQEIMNLRVGSGLPNIQQKDLKDLKLLVSNDSEEQSKIAHFLSSNEEKIETEKKILAQYELQKKYLLATLFV